MRDACSYCCPASDRRQFFGGATHGLKRSSRSRFGRRHDCALHDRRVANHDAGTARFRQHFNRHLAIGFRAAEIDQERGVAILVDLGGAETNSEMAIEMLPESRRARVVVCNAPVVEGAVMAATEAASGASLEAVRRTAEELTPV